MMHIRTLVILASLFLAVPLFAKETKIYSSYESVRQALLKNSVASVQKTSLELASVARSKKQEAIAAKAEKVAGAANVASARTAFAALSDEVIKFRAAVSGERPFVAYCAMEKKSWLQPVGTQISNPYLDTAMRSCGEIVKDEAPSKHHQ